MTEISRRAAIGGIATTLALPLIGTPALLRAAAKPRITDGVMSGDAGADTATLWCRADGPGRMLVEWSTTESFADARRVPGGDANAAGDFTCSARLSGLPPGQTVFYRVRVEGEGGSSEPVLGRLRTPAHRGGRVSFVFGGDQCGGGWGINPDWGGLRIYDAMLRTNPDFLVHLGDRIYADNVLRENVPLDDGTVWRNLVTPAKSHAAQSLDDFRGNYRYNLLDDNVRRFNAAVPQLVTWDDHETTDNWWPGMQVAPRRAKRLGYASRDVAQLAPAARQAFFDYTPLDTAAVQSNRLWRAVAYGPLVEVFLLDQRSHRSANIVDGRATMAEDSTLLGRNQRAWLKAALTRSAALWKVIASPLPLAHIGRGTRVGDFDKVADGVAGLPVGREQEVAEVLKAIRAARVRNTVWIAADVHYAAANHFHPDRAVFRDFAPFWEFIAGPFHTQAFAPGRLDTTFGPHNRYVSTRGVKGNPPPSAGWCNFGHVAIDGASGTLTLSFLDVDGRTMWTTTLEAER